MKRLAFLISAFWAILITACNSGSSEQARIQAERDSLARVVETIKQDSIKKATEAAEALRQREAKREQERAEKSQRLKRFVGTYHFDYAHGKTDLWHAPIMIVHEDGRAVVVCETAGGSVNTEYVGNVVPRDEYAFSLTAARSTLPMHSLRIWRDGRDIGHTGTSRLWTDNFVFDISNGFMYRTIEGYKNRDIAAPEYIKFTHSSSTSY